MENDFAQPAAYPVKAGDVVAGKYRIERMLGAGGMGFVVAAKQIDLDRTVALKFLLPDANEQKDLVARFAREARIAAKLQGEHVARVLDVGVLDEKSPFIVMEFLEGEDLARVLKRRGPLPPDVAVGYVLEAAEGLAEAHALGIIHRDLKPANLFLAKRTRGTPLIKVLDFGVSKFSEMSGQASVTSASSLLGSPAYMPPEQLWSSRSADVRSDIWSLGVVLYELLAADGPFPHMNMLDLVTAILHRPARPLLEVRSDLPPGLGSIVMRCIEKDPARRFADVGELAAALLSFGPPSSQHSVERIVQMLSASGTEGGEAAMPSAIESAPATVPETGRSSGAAAVDTSIPRREPTRRRWPTAAWTLTALVAIATGIVISRTSRKAGDHPPTPAASNPAPVVSERPQQLEPEPDPTPVAAAPSASASPSADTSAKRGTPPRTRTKPSQPDPLTRLRPL